MQCKINIDIDLCHSICHCIIQGKAKTQSKIIEKMFGSSGSLATPSVIGSGSKVIGQSSHELGNAVRGSADKMKQGSSQDCVRFVSNVLITSGGALGADNKKICDAIADYMSE